MVSPRWRKVLRDLWGNRRRTFLVVLSIAVGVFALGMIMGTNTMLGKDLPGAWNGINPSHAELYPSEFSSDIIPAIEEIEGVDAVTVQRGFTVNIIQTDDRGNEKTMPMGLTFLLDFNDIKISKILPVDGSFPPLVKTILVERKSLPFLDAEIGDVLTVELSDGRRRDIQVSGSIHDLDTEPVEFSGRATAYASFEMLDWLGQERTFDELLIRVTNDTDGLHPSPEHVKRVSDNVRNKLEKSGLEVYWVWIPEPGIHPATQTVNALLAILGVLGSFSLFLSGFLVVNIINSIITQQIRQIGIMKSIGARAGQLFTMYIVTVIVFGLLSLLIAVPLGVWAAFSLASYLAGLINFDLPGASLSSTVLWAQIGVGIAIPVLAALIPVIRGVFIPVRIALSEKAGGGGDFGSSVIDRGMSWVTISVMRLSRPVSIALRNTIRRKARLILTLFTMILGGAVFISVTSVYASLLATIDDGLAYFAYDISLDFNKSHRIDELDAIAKTVDGVVATDSWIGESVRRVRDDGTEGPNLVILGVNYDTEVIVPNITHGRWLQADDRNSLVLSSEVLIREKGLKVGDVVNLKLEGKETEWLIVGLARTTLTGPLIYANQDYLAQKTGRYRESSGIQIVANQHDGESQALLADALEKRFEAAGMKVTDIDTTTETRENIVSQFNIISSLLAVMALLIAVVGGLGLMGTMSISVLERTKEVGIMRAVEASDRSILRVVLVEGVFIGLLSWALAIVVAYPLGWWISDFVGQNLLESELTYTFAWWGAGLWIIGVLLISTGASFFPARRASRISVRETLAYE
ncbi:MAG: putative ABC transport system permease protein [Cellvibrionaceae bacterium]|jgi:putative ABC transport system permease protein